MSIFRQLLHMTKARSGRRKYCQTDKFRNVADSTGVTVHAPDVFGLAVCGTVLLNNRYTDEEVNCTKCALFSDEMSSVD